MLQDKEFISIQQSKDIMVQLYKKYNINSKPKGCTICDYIPNAKITTKLLNEKVIKIIKFKESA